MLLRDIIGQEKLKQQLVDMVQHQRLSHALLFVGPEGSGALPLAIAFGFALACMFRRIRGWPLSGFCEKRSLRLVRLVVRCIDGWWRGRAGYWAAPHQIG